MSSVKLQADRENFKVYMSAADKLHLEQSRRERMNAMHAKFLLNGAPKRWLQPFKEVSDEELHQRRALFCDQFYGASIWAAWCRGKVAQYHIAQWLVSETPRPMAACALMRFLLRIGNLSSDTGPNATLAVKVLRSDLPPMVEARDTVANVARTQLPLLHAATRRWPYHRRTFLAALEPILVRLPEAAIEFAVFAPSEWALALVRTSALIERPLRPDCLAKKLSSLLAVGGFGRVEIGWNKTWAIPYALKRQNTAMVMGKDHVDKILTEWRVHTAVHSRFVLECLYSYVDDKDLVLALRLMPGGDLSLYVKRAIEQEVEMDGFLRYGLDKLSVESPMNSSLWIDQPTRICRFYLASVVLGLEALHTAGFVYRDLKDRNILLDFAGQARLGDFGLAVDVSKRPTSGSAGTKGYWAPEQLDKRLYSTSPDFWTLGVVAYQFHCLKLPFRVPSSVPKDEQKDVLKQMVLTKDFDRDVRKHPVLGKVPHLLDLLEGLMTKDPHARLGVRRGFSEIKEHPYFAYFDWDKLASGIMPAPLRPSTTSINAAAPNEKSLKPEFQEWAEKPTPKEASTVFAGWEQVNRLAVEELTVDLLDANPNYFQDRCALPGLELTESSSRLIDSFEESSTRTTQPDSEDTPSAPEPRRWPIGTAKWSQLGDVASSKQLSHVLHAGLKQDRNSSRSSLFEVPAPEVKHDSCCAIC
uniref:Protein kinase domain-containing protein n=1 Tax=Chrysotila carterae TaxID=13221 RepID=A0A7S4F4H9_CHRCT